jgi:hypothetical protein
VLTLIYLFLMWDSLLPKLFKHLPFQSNPKYVYGLNTLKAYELLIILKNSNKLTSMTLGYIKILFCVKKATPLGLTFRMDGKPNLIKIFRKYPYVDLKKKKGQSSKWEYFRKILIKFNFFIYSRRTLFVPSCFILFCPYPILRWSHSHGYYKICVPVCISFLYYVLLYNATTRMLFRLIVHRP